MNTSLHLLLSSSISGIVRGMLRIVVTLTLLYSPFAQAALADLADFTHLKDNTARYLGNYNCTNLEGDGRSCGSITDYSRFTYDPLRKNMLMFGGGHSATFRDDVDVFDFSTLVWTPAYTPTSCTTMKLANWDRLTSWWTHTDHPASRHTYDLLPITKDGKYLILLNGVFAQGSECGQRDDPDTPKVNESGGNARIAHYDIAAKTWSFTPTKDTDAPWGNTASSELDPESGKIMVVKDNIVYTYDSNKMVIATIKEDSPLFGSSGNLVYFKPNDKFYYINRSAPVKVWEITPSAANRSTLAGISSIVELTMTDTPSLPETGFAYDPVNQVIGGGIKNGVFHAFDPLNEIWIAETMLLEANIDPAIVAPDISLQTQSYHALDYHLEKNVYLFISDRRTWAYRYKKLNPNAPPKAPLVFINASPSQVALGASVSLEWNGIYAVGCESSGGAWLGSRGTNGSESVTPASLPMTYTLTCTGKGGDRVSQTTTVTLPGPVASDGGTSGGGGASSGSSGGASSSGIASDNLSSSGSGALWWDLLVILGVAVGIGVYRNR